jgi:hypothetical protein
MESSTNVGERPSLSAQVAALLTRAVEEDVVARVGAVIAMAWVWLTVLGFTLTVTREVISVAAGRNVGPGFGGGLESTLTLLLATTAVLVVIPAIVVWNHLLHLTQILARLVTMALYWDSKAEERETQVVRLQETIREIVQTCVRWVRAFALTWLVILIVNALGSMAILIYLLADTL